ncbi:MAG: hypothetical protein M3444_09630, partial [Acidobacteriota bacterium]|nr:hypothetical protein [Acidobacteriota bacterium]
RRGGGDAADKGTSQMSKQLQEPILDRGIRNTNFFNGRLLTADDLKTEQAASRESRRQLGRAVGDGVVQGLEVVLVSPGTTTTSPVVSVTKGLALNRRGQTLALPDAQQVALTRRLDVAPPEVGAFAVCDPPTYTFSNLNDGVYVLVVGPASGFQEYAPMRGQRPGDSASGCGNRYAVEGVKFRLAKLDVSAMTQVSAATRTQISALMAAGDAPSLSKLRNLLAHLCFGTEELSALARDLLKASGDISAYASYGAIDFLRARGELTDCEVPLALVYWSAGAARFADMWSVRRRVTHGALSLPPLLADRRAAEGEAVIQQFQEHVESLRTTESFPELAIASNYFRYLPPAGIIPFKQGVTKGFSTNTFFSGIVRRQPEFIDGSVVRALLREAVNYEPFDLTSGELVWLYKVRQNVETDQGGTVPPTYLVFAGPHVPYKATPRFDREHWDFSNYGCEKDGAA